jgi:hypothetical protein
MTRANRAVPESKNVFGRTGSCRCWCIKVPVSWSVKLTHHARTVEVAGTRGWERIIGHSETGPKRKLSIGSDAARYVSGLDGG